MQIDEFYSETDKSNFYLGMITQVYASNSYVQVENLSLLQHRKLGKELLFPNTINYFVIIDSLQGLFIGRVYQAKVQSSTFVHDEMYKERDENIFPEMGIDVLGVLENGVEFTLPGFSTVGISDKVYVANKLLIEKYLKSLELQKYISTTDEQRIPQTKLSNFAVLSNFDNVKITIQPNTLLDHHLMVVGATNTGKSTSSLSILSELLKTNRKVLIVDPTGEYSKTFKEDQVKKFRLGDDAILPTGEVSFRQWEMLFQTNDNTQGAILSEAIKSLRLQTKNQNKGVFIKNGRIVQEVQSELTELTNDDVNFDIQFLPNQINQESVVESTKLQYKGKYTFDTFKSNTNSWLVQKVQHEFENTSLLKFFRNSGTEEENSLLKILDQFVETPKQSSYIDASEIGTTDGIGSMIIDLVCNYLISKKKEDICPFVMFVDEVHRYTKKDAQGLTSIAREGRKKGIFLFLTTQNPKDVPDVLLGQVGTLIIHRLTHSDELQTVKGYLEENTINQVRKLNQGEAIITGINLLQDIHVKFIESGRTHDNKTPIL